MKHFYCKQKKKSTMKHVIRALVVVPLIYGSSFTVSAQDTSAEAVMKEQGKILLNQGRQKQKAKDLWE